MVPLAEAVVAVPVEVPVEVPLLVDELLVEDEPDVELVVDEEPVELPVPPVLLAAAEHVDSPLIGGAAVCDHAPCTAAPFCVTYHTYQVQLEDC